MKTDWLQISTTIANKNIKFGTQKLDEHTISESRCHPAQTIFLAGGASLDLKCYEPFEAVKLKVLFPVFKNRENNFNVYSLKIYNRSPKKTFMVLIFY